MDLKRRIYEQLEQILLGLEEVLSLSKVTERESAPFTKDIHLEVRERFLLRVKIENITDSLSKVYTLLQELKYVGLEQSYWNNLPSVSPFKHQQRENLSLLKSLFERLLEKRGAK